MLCDDERTFLDRGLKSAKGHPLRIGDVCLMTARLP